MELRNLCAECGAMGQFPTVLCAGSCREPMPLCEDCMDEHGPGYICELCQEERQQEAAEEDE
jgi:hypothetical protein